MIQREQLTIRFSIQSSRTTIQQLSAPPHNLSTTTSRIRGTLDQSAIITQVKLFKSHTRIRKYRLPLTPHSQYLPLCDADCFRRKRGASTRICTISLPHNATKMPRGKIKNTKLPTMEKAISNNRAFTSYLSLSCHRRPLLPLLLFAIDTSEHLHDK